MRTIINWFYWNFNKYHWRVIKEALFGYPWDYDFMFRLERAKLDEMRHYFKHKGIAENNKFVASRIALMIKMIDIFMEHVETSSYEIQGEPFSDELFDENISKSNQSIKYTCLVNVNLKNIDRFIDNKENKDYYIQHPDELYKIKAQRLYERMRSEWMETFWD